MTTTSLAQLELDGVATAGEAPGVKPKSLARIPAASTQHARFLSAQILVPSTENRPTHEPRTNATGAVALHATAFSATAESLQVLLTFSQAARMLGISLRQFRRLVDGGKVGFVKVSERSPRIRPSELQRFLDASAIKYSEVPS